MFGRNKKRGLGMTAASGLVFDPEIRRAAAQAAPPLARLAYVLGKRTASQQLDGAGQTFGELAALLSSAGLQLAEQLHLAEPEPSRRRVVPVLGGAAVVAVVVVVAADPSSRRRLQRLVAH